MKGNVTTELMDRKEALSQGSTTPDFFYSATSDLYEGVCVYLDGMSRDLHGNPARQKRDRQIREELPNRGYEVVEITYAQLFDRDAMSQHFYLCTARSPYAHKKVQLSRVTLA